MTTCEPHIATIVSNSSSSSDDELPSPTTTTFSRSGRYSRSSSYSARMVRRAEAIVCRPGSSLVAVMVQAIAHRVKYVWVIEDDCSVVGIVTFISKNLLKGLGEAGKAPWYWDENGRVLRTVYVWELFVLLLMWCV
ncbi:CBS domain-containing protein CBSX5-like [Abeliophyllum distichum]|uniref:CBS domain-containing protein CBSX5-like n=1 Tax=Abeliophyllum distichum TaxID=126358 RepID=A0ABD1VXZ4_9LAMI